MNIVLESQPAASLASEALVTYAFEKDDRIEGMVAELDRASSGQLRALADSGEFTGKSLEMLLLHFPSGIAARRLLVIGAGKPAKFCRADLRRIAGAAVRFLKVRGVRHFAFLSRESERDCADLQAVVEGLVFAEYESDKYRTKRENQKSMESVSLAGWGDSPECRSALARGRVLAESQNFGRDLINEPSNYLTPRLLAEKAEAMAREAGLECDILGEDRIRELGMGALLSVAQGSAEPPRVIVLKYTPAQTRPGAPILGLIGKGVTFDTGGISIKPANNMEKMKYDMGGAGTMLASMRAIAALKPAVPVIMVVPATENMPGSRAQKPGDVQTAMSGKTIEVINTDAEGRLILADAVTYARRLGATHLVDAATLTGAIEVALANVNVGVFGQPQDFLDRFLASARKAGEKMWPMPLDDEYEEMIKSGIADIRNTGSGKGGGAITAAWFIKEFAEDLPWIHLDIASTCWSDDGKPWMAKGPTGVAVRTIVDFALSL
jgi:leucyl aminopeptidase